MKDIEDVIASGAPPGLRLPLTSVNINPRRKPKSRLLQDPLNPSPQIPGTQTIFVKTFGCSHNQSDSEYMAGQLSAFGYALTDISEEADLWLINTCTVKSPSQSAMETLISKGKNAKKHLVVAGCVPQGSRYIKELEGISIIGVQQIDRVVEVVEETLKGHEVRLLSRKTLPALDLPKVRKNEYVEILPINVGCLGACTYCKTKHARGHLGSYTVESLVERLRTVISEGVKEIWLSSEDTGAYGRDIGVNLPILLNALIAELPADRSTMLRIGMTNPPFILEHLEEIAKVLLHPCVYSFLHVPVQSGSDAVLAAMNREYTVRDFRAVVDSLIRLVPEIQIATDVICGFPGETIEDFAQTIALIKEYQFPQVHISQFYPRPGTPAARMKKVPSTQVKNRSRELTTIFESFNPYKEMEGQIVRIWITEIASDGVHLVGHTKGYVQVLVIAPDNMLGTSTEVKITSVGRWSVFGELIETSTEVNLSLNQAHQSSESFAAYECENLCPCSSESECYLTTLKTGTKNVAIIQTEASADIIADSSSAKNGRVRTFISSIKSVLLRRRVKGTEGNHSLQKCETSTEVNLSLNQAHRGSESFAPHECENICPCSSESECYLTTMKTGTKNVAVMHKPERWIGSNLSMMDSMLVVGGLIVSLLAIVMMFTRLFSQMLSS